MTVLSDFVSLRKLSDESVTWKLLRAQNAPIILAIIDNHFDEMNRRIPVVEFISLVEADLEELNLRLDAGLERSAQAYCDQWRSDGYLFRRAMTQTRMETYEPTTGALMALSYAKSLLQPHRTATESRLNTIMDQVSALALAIDPSEGRRRQSLLRERELIDAQLEAIDQGNYTPLDHDRALEAAQEIISLAREIPTDFGRVRDDFALLNKTLYETIVNAGDGYEDILDDIFGGVDRISQSPSGRSFRGFYNLLRDLDRSATFQDEINEILQNSLAEDLTLEQRIFLRDLIRILLQQSHEVNGTMTSFARSLRRFVQNQNYQQDRILKKTIDRALGLAHRLLEDRIPSRSLDWELNLTGISIKPISRYKLKNPLESTAAPLLSIEVSETESLSFEDLRLLARQSEIDFAELADNVNACLSRQMESSTREDVTVGSVLDVYPATQGVASVVGLVALALDQGKVAEGTETVQWETENDRVWQADLQRFIFFQPVEGV